MKHNVGKIDKVIRIIVALLLVYLGYLYTPWLYVLAAIVLLTAIISWCGLYSILGINTCKTK